MSFFPLYRFPVMAVRQPVTINLCTEFFLQASKIFLVPISASGIYSSSLATLVGSNLSLGWAEWIKY